MEARASTGLRVEDIRKSYTLGADTVEVLRGVSFAIEPGQAAAIIGPSGSGKSTLLHLIGSLDRPTGGAIVFDDVRPADLDERSLASFRNRRIGFVFQDHHLLPQFSLLENVLLPALVSSRTGHDPLARARELLEKVGLGGRSGHRPGEVSGGERQRAAVARALINHPGLLLCDEPTGNLDEASAAAVATLIFDLHRAEGGVLLVVTHSLQLAGRFPRRLRLVEGVCSEA